MQHQSSIISARLLASVILSSALLAALLAANDSSQSSSQVQQYTNNQQSYLSANNTLLDEHPVAQQTASLGHFNNNHLWLPPPFGHRALRRHTTLEVGDLPSAVLVSDNCPIMRYDSTTYPGDGPYSGKVVEDPNTGLRTFRARIVGIFACTEQDASNVDADFTLDFRLAKPVLDLAVNAVNTKYAPQLHFDVAYRTAPDMCVHQQAVGHAADEYYVHGVNYFVGPGCRDTLKSVGQLASYWNVPMCSTGYLPDLITSKFKPLTLIQLSVSIQSAGEMLNELFKMYNWHHLTIITDNKHPEYSLMRDGLLKFFTTMFISNSKEARTTGASKLQQQQQDSPESSSPDSSSQRRRQQPLYGPHYINISSLNFDFSRKEQPNYDAIILEAAAHSRVMLFLSRITPLAHLLEAAHAQGLSKKKGRFVFMAYEIFEPPGDRSISTSLERTVYSLMEARLKKDLQSTTEIIRNNDTDTGGDDSLPFEPSVAELNETRSDPQLYFQYKFEKLARKLTHESLEPLMTMSVDVADEPKFEALQAKVIEMSEKEFNYRLTKKVKYSLELATTIYDCVMLYANHVQFILNNTHLSLVDGKIIFDMATRYFFESLSGAMKITKFGHKIIDFKLKDYSPIKHRLKTIARYSALDRSLTMVPDAQPHWAVRNMSTPKSDPRCRKDDLHCSYVDDLNDQLRSSSNLVLGLWLVVIVLTLVAMISSVIGWIVYRRFRIKSELLNLWWSIRYEDIVFEEENDAARSISSLAISHESFMNEGAQLQLHSLQHSPGYNKTELTRRLAKGTAAAAAGKSALEKKSSTKSKGAGSIYASGGASPGHAPAAIAEDNQSLGTVAQSLGVYQSYGPHIARTDGQLSAAQSTSTISATHSLGANKLLPLLSRSSGRAMGPQSGAAGGTRRGGGQSSKAGSACALTMGMKEEPSISSQNRYIKMRLGTVLGGGPSSAGHTTIVGLYKASRVAVKHLNVKNLTINRQLLIELRQVRDLTHDNLIKFIGLCPDEPHYAIVSEICERGNLQDLLQNDSIRLDWTFRFSIMNDIIDGLVHLHASPIQYHGRLKSSNCVIDSRFVIKLTDYGLPALLSTCELNEGEAINPRLLLWTAPEHLRTKHPLMSGSQKGDIYSLAIIMQEIITRCGPFECEPILCGATELMVGRNLPAKSRGGVARAAGALVSDSNLWSMKQQQLQQQQLIEPPVVQHKQRLEPAEIVNLVRMGLSPPFRPYFRSDVVAAMASNSGAGVADFDITHLVETIQSCWQEAPAARPTASFVKIRIKKIRGRNGANLMDNLLQRMERYTDNLESLVEQKTAELTEEKKRTEELLYEMLPRFVVDQLKYGHSVTPEAYDAVTIYFSDIKGFTTLAAQSTPIEVVNLLNQLYTEFDDCIARYDVYKVETIGDAYMVVSGLPVRNGDLHAKEIAEMSLAMLDLIRNFKVPHMPEQSLELRIGIHTGPCAAGVVGTRMYRYCLFGDTVNTASRMESQGEPMKIHISEDSAQVLSRFGCFEMEPRGEIDIKGKGIMSTFWLVRKGDQQRR